MAILEQLKKLANENKPKEFADLYKTLSEEEIREIEKELGIYQNVNEHHYTGFNLLFLATLKEPWTFWTFCQYKNIWRVVKKWSKGVQILVPIFKEEGEEKKVRFFKSIYVFHINDTDLIDNIEKQWEK